MAPFDRWPLTPVTPDPWQKRPEYYFRFQNWPSIQNWHVPKHYLGQCISCCILVQEPPPPQKNAIKDVSVRCLLESDPLCKCYETRHGRPYWVRYCSDCCWSTPVNQFRCVATPKLSPCQCNRWGPWAYYSDSRCCGSAWLFVWLDLPL